ncbi:MAG: hypothetical protein M3126_02255 [Candidatus Eremiobacteraeota bacterium]|nr:hypothetical protein [Candidatus Eremiobacteraeota bacterium]
MLRPAVALLCLSIVLGAACAQAARPLPDLHKWDSYFALFARDSSVPWKQTTVRLDTYSGARVDLAVYQADPADVIVAGSAGRPRVLDTRDRHAIARWTFTPAGGYRFATNQVEVPLGNREGFFVVEARRANVAEQVWVNRTRIGIVGKASAGALLLYGADLGTGKAISHMRVLFLAGKRFETRFTDGYGVVRWSGPRRPVFALAQFAKSEAFLSLLPQAPLTNAVAGVMVDSAGVHAGDTMRVVGFARKRSGNVFKPETGSAAVSLRLRGKVIAEKHVALDAAGSFVAEMQVPAGSRSGDYTVLMNAGGAGAGTQLHVDADANGLVLAVVAACGERCTPNDDVPLEVRAMRAGLPVANARVAVEAVRSPHAGDLRGPQWGISKVFSQVVTTGADGIARASIARPTDGLSSTYGIDVSSGGATAATRVTVATAPVALNLVLDHAEQSLGNALPFDVYATNLSDGRPAPRVTVRVQLMHGSSVAEQIVKLDANGHAHGAFSNAELGSNLVLARATVNGADALDAQEVRVVPHAANDSTGGSSSDVGVSLDRSTYHPRDRITVRASCEGASGDALLTYETPLQIDSVVRTVTAGGAGAMFVAANAPGAVVVGAAFVRNGALHWNTVPAGLSGPGRAGRVSVSLEGSDFAAGSVAHLKIDEGNGADRTMIVRMTAGIPSGSARFDGAPELLSIGQASSQATALASADWHAWVDATPARASVLAFDRNDASVPGDLSLAQADTRDVYWHVTRGGQRDLAIPMPQKAGTYTVSVLEFGDDGHVAADSSAINVR